MWPRVIEGMLGCWLLVTPFVFRGTASVEEYTTSAVVSGALVIVMAVLSFWEPTRLARFATLGVSLWLSLHGYFAAERPGPPAAQNEIMIGLTLLLFAIIPNEASQPPRAWRHERQTPASAAQE
jgi:hypothetical protein